MYRYYKYFLVYGVLLNAVLLSAADLIRVLPVTGKILMLEVKDGHIDAWGIGEDQTANRVYSNPVDLVKALDVGSYSISSTDDPAYVNGVTPIFSGRKSKALDYNDPYVEVQYVMGHHIYLELADAMQPGKTYRLDCAGLFDNREVVEWVFDASQLRSETVRVNLVGYPVVGVKIAYLSHWLGDFEGSVHTKGGLSLDDKQDAAFQVVNVATGEVAHSGTIELRMRKTTQETTSDDFGPEYNFSHADVWQADFSALQIPGEYRVVIEGIGSSFPFEISDESTREPFYYAMRGLYSQRQGIVKEIEPGQVLPRDHHPDDKVWRWDSDWPGGEDVSEFDVNSPRVRGIWGYYHDAGDWDGYVHHAKTPIPLLLLFDLAPDRFGDGEVANRYKLHEDDEEWIEEGTNGLPDLLDEAGWLIHYYRRARSVLINEYGGTGGVPGYVGRDAIDGSGIVAWTDAREWYLSAENVEQTYWYAGLAAWYAQCLNEFHQLENTGSHPDSAGWIAEALAAWQWAEARGTASDDERRVRGFAAANIYRINGDVAFQTIAKDTIEWEPTKNHGEWSNPTEYDTTISIFSMLSDDHNGLDTELRQLCKDEVVRKALDTKVENIEANAFRMEIERNQFMQLGAINTPRVSLIAMAHHLTGDSRYLEAIQHAVSYVLGGNQVNTAYLSGLGERSDQSIFNPNGWLTNDFNSMVYSSEPFIGLTSYFGATSYWFTGSVHAEYFSRTAAHPQARDFPDEWPGAESNFHNRYSIQGGEYTVHQQNNYMILATGYVKAMSTAAKTAYEPNARPLVVLDLQERQAFPRSGCELSVVASADVRTVRYYYDWHFIGESNDAQSRFKVNWVPMAGVPDEVLITAVGVDDRGKLTRPSAAAERTIVLSGDADCEPVSDLPAASNEPYAFTPLYALQRIDNAGFFFTIDEAEKNALLNQSPAVYQDLGISQQVISNATQAAKPVYRLDASTNVAYYLIRFAELHSVLSQSSEFQYGGVPFYALAEEAAGTAAVHRFYHTASGTHYYTISEAEKDELIATRSPEDMRYEGVAWWAFGPEGI